MISWSPCLDYVCSHHIDQVASSLVALIPNRILVHVWGYRGGTEDFFVALECEPPECCLSSWLAISSTALQITSSGKREVMYRVVFKSYHCVHFNL